MKMSVNLQALLKSEAIVKAIEQGKEQAGKAADKNAPMQIDMALAMLRTVDRISVSAHPEEGR